MTALDPYGKPALTLIAGVAKNGVIGCANQLPWHLPEDLRYFKANTEGHTVVMGRKTFESIGHALPKRRNLVISREPKRSHEGVEFVTSLTEALGRCGTEEEVFVIGGAALYQEAMARADRLLITHIERSYEGDTLFPPIPADFTETSRLTGTAKSDPGLEFAWVEYRRPKP